MIYLIRSDGQIEACETKDSAERCEVRGFVRCSYEEWVDGWRDKYLFRLAELRADARYAATPPWERAVGGGTGKPEQVAGLPIGMVKQWVDGR